MVFNTSAEKPNVTDYCAADELDRNPSASLFIYPSMILGVVVMFLNVLVVVSVAINKRLHKPAFYYVSSLAVADFVAGLIIAYTFLRTYLNHNQVVKAELLIKQGLFIASVGASILSLLVISFNRYFVIVYPFRYRVRMNNVIVGVTVATIWLYSIAFGVLPVAFWNSYNYHDDCSRIIPGLTRTYAFVLSLHVVVAIVIILVLYTAILFKVRQGYKFRKEALSSEDKAHIKVAKTLFIVSAAFAICWLPYMTICILDMANSIKLKRYTPFFAILAVLNSLLNPLIYACRDQEMRKTFKNILCPCACWRRCHQREAPDVDQSDSTCLTTCYTKAESDVPYQRNGNIDSEEGASGTAESPLAKYSSD